ncbi:MAG: hypothetical protein ACTSUE_18360 [Promethearchaeota archaeon]
MVLDFELKELITPFLEIFLVPFLIGSIVYRIRKDKKENRQVSNVKYIILIAFILDYYAGFINIGFWQEWIPIEWRSPGSEEGLGLNTFQTGAVVTLGLCLVFYLHGWDRVLYMPLYLYGGIIMYFLWTGHDELFPFYVYGGGILSLIMLFNASIKMRENNAFGLAIFYFISFISLFLQIVPDVDKTYLPLIIPFITYGFGVIYAFGLFKPFKENVPETLQEEQADAEIQGATVSTHVEVELNHDS